MSIFIQKTRNKKSTNAFILQTNKKEGIITYVLCVIDIYIEDRLNILRKKNSQLLKNNLFFFDSYQYICLTKLKKIK